MNNLSYPLIVTYKESLPNNIPPSYKGQDIKIMYKVCIGIGRIGRPLALIRLPFRVMELKGAIFQFSFSYYVFKDIIQIEGRQDRETIVN